MTTKIAKPDEETSFFQKVYKTTRLIPPGRITSYGAIAKFLASPGSTRMVGWALNKSAEQAEFVPAHRVVNRNGLLTGKNHFGWANTMRELLESEGIIIENNKIVNFKEKCWDPAQNIQ